MTPAIPFARAADQVHLRSLKLERSQIPPAGRVMFCRGRKILGHGDVGKLGEFLYIPKGVDTLSLSAADYDDVKAWIG